MIRNNEIDSEFLRNRSDKIWLEVAGSRPWTAHIDGVKQQGELAYIAGSLRAASDGLIDIDQIQFDLVSFDKTFALDGYNLGYENPLRSSWNNRLKKERNYQQPVSTNTLEMMSCRFNSLTWLHTRIRYSEIKKDIDHAGKEMKKITTCINRSHKLSGSPKLILSLLNILEKHPSIFLCELIYDISKNGLGADGHIIQSDKIYPIQR